MRPPEDLPPRPRSDRARRTPLFRPAGGDDLAGEMEHHRACLSERLEREGGTPEDAAAEARRRLPAPGAATGEEPRPTGPGTFNRWRRRREVTMRTADVIADWIQDGRLGLRAIARRPGNALAGMLALGIGLGGSALVLSLADAIFLRPLPVEDLDGLVSFYEVSAGSGASVPVSYPAFRDYRERVGRGVRVAGRRGFRLGLGVGRSRVEIDGAAVSGDYFDVLGLRPAAGRLLGPDDDVPGAEAVVVISHDLWKGRFGADPDLIGQMIDVGAGSARVVGVAPAGFRGVRLDTDEQAWFPFARIRDLSVGLYGQVDVLATRFFTWVYPVARLPAGVTHEALVERLGAVRQALWRELGPDGMPEVADDPPPFEVEPLRDTALGGDRERLLGFLGLVTALSVFTLLVGTVNAMQLRLAHLKTRAGEIGVRRALGATRSRVVRQIVIDTVPVVLGGAVVGILFAQAVLVALRRFTLPGGVSLARLPLALDPGTMALLSVIAGYAVVMSGLVPAWLGTRRDPTAQIRRGRAGASGAALVLAQVTLSTTLVVTAGLFVRSFLVGLGTPLGFEADGLVALTVSPDAHGREDIRDVITVMTDVAKAVPGVTSVAMAAHVPLAPSEFEVSLIPLGEPPREEGPGIGVNAVAGPFLSTLGIALEEGRDLSLDDDPAPVAVVNRAAADILFPGRSPLGRYFKVFAFQQDSIRIVGVAASSLAESVRDEAHPFVYVDARVYHGFLFSATAHLVARVDGDPSSALGRLQIDLAAALPTLPAIDPRTVRSQVTRVLMPQHLGAILFGVFGGSAAILAAIGVAGVIASELTRRRREMGIRAALGATFARSVAPALRATLLATAAGLALGVGLTTRAGSRLDSFLVGVDLVDPGSIAGALALLVLCAALAVAWALHRHAHVEPARVLAADGAGGGT